MPACRQPDSGPMEVYINQLAPATLNSSALGLSMKLQASFFHGPTTAAANITFAPLQGSSGQVRICPAEAMLVMSVSV